MKYYIGKRINPQLTNPYYFAYGKLTKKEAKKNTYCLYGNIILTEYDKKEQYQEAKEQIKGNGFTLYDNEIL